ncbi:MAG TPA: YHS domain-containing protein, partial [Amaricoccus sp.]|nr:YHS domain-containing protein [Amaricoccus sp.]
MHATDPEAAPTERDPVCGMTVDPRGGGPAHEHDGRRFHFCSTGCRDRFAAAPADHLTATDRVCGMSVDRATARHVARHGGAPFFFCSDGCLARFEAAPERFVAGAGRAPAVAVPPGTIWTCPMHPEIRRDGPGDCPNCGMALEPAGVPGDAPNPELADFTRRLAVGALLT